MALHGPLTRQVPGSSGQHTHRSTCRPWLLQYASYLPMHQVRSPHPPMTVLLIDLADYFQSVMGADQAQADVHGVDSQAWHLHSTPNLVAFLLLAIPALRK